MGFVRYISKAKLRVSINKWVRFVVHTQSGAAAFGTFGYKLPAYFVPKVSVISRRLSRIVFHWEDLQAAGPVT